LKIFNSIYTYKTYDSLYIGTVLWSYWIRYARACTHDGRQRWSDGKREGVKTEIENSGIAIGAWFKSRDGKWKFRKCYW